MEAIIFISWLLAAIIIGAMGDGKEIGSGKAFLIALFLSPLIGAIFVATSPNAVSKPFQSGDITKHINAGDKKMSDGDLDGALSEYEMVLPLSSKTPNTHFKIACIYSRKTNPQKSFFHISKAVQDGFKEFEKIINSQDLKYLRELPEFKSFAQNGYKLDEIGQSDDTISKLERLAQLKEKGILTQTEFEEQKQKILAS